MSVAGVEFVERVVGSSQKVTALRRVSTIRLPPLRTHVCSPAD